MGPVIAGLVVPIGIAGTIWVISGIYIVGIVLTYCLRDRIATESPHAPPIDRCTNPTGESTSGHLVNDAEMLSVAGQQQVNPDRRSQSLPLQ
jgi:hypothetical protein